MELDLKKKSITVKYGEKAYSVSAPSNALLKQFLEDKRDDFEKTIDLLDKCGLPSELSWELDAETLIQVVEAITPQKKS